MKRNPNAYTPDSDSERMLYKVAMVSVFTQEPSHIPRVTKLVSVLEKGESGSGPGNEAR